MKKPTQKQNKPETSEQQQDKRVYEMEVNARAHELWEAGGCQHGNDLAHWLEAERQVQARYPRNEA